MQLRRLLGQVLIAASTFASVVACKDSPEEKLIGAFDAKLINGAAPPYATQDPVLQQTLSYKGGILEFRADHTWTLQVSLALGSQPTVSGTGQGTWVIDGALVTLTQGTATSGATINDNVLTTQLYGVPWTFQKR